MDHTSDDKKAQVESDFIENSNTPVLPNEQPLAMQGTPERLIAERKLVRKLDMRVLPMIVIIYIMNYIDRTNITTARLKGLEDDLGLSDIQYSAVLSILYISYCPMQVPSNMILNYISRPSFYIGGCVVGWGFISAMTGLTQSFSGIAACRVLLGIPEAAFYPGTIYLLSRWYTKRELALRSAILYGGLLISNAFGSLMAAGILSEMEGKRGIRAWRWLFFIEGAITIAVGFFSMWALPDYPNNTRWITGAERHLAQVRLAEDAGEADRDNAEESPVQGLKMALNDRKVWLFSLLNVAQFLGLSFVNFFPTLTRTLGYSTTISLVLAAPPWIIATLVCVFNAWHADRTGERFLHVTGWWWGAMVGFIMALSTMSIPARYIAMILMACGYAGFSLTLVWVANVVPRPPAKRAAAIGLVNGIGHLGQLIGSFTWRAEWSPGYHPSMGISLASFGISTVFAIYLRQYLVRENRKLDEREDKDLDRQRVEEAARLEGITFDEALQRRRGFRYLY